MPWLFYQLDLWLHHCAADATSFDRSHPHSSEATEADCALQLSGLDETLERLDIRCNRFMKGSNRYKEGINTLSQSQASFADFLEEFCGGTDEESMMLGNEHKPMLLHVWLHFIHACMQAAIMPLLYLNISQCVTSHNA